VWDLRDQYLSEAGLDKGVKGVAARMLLDAMQVWDRKSAANVDEFSTLSHYIADRIHRAYQRDAHVVYPPVDTEFFTPPASGGPREDFYLTASRFVPYKRIDLIAATFAELPDRRLIVVGDGPEAAKVRAASGPNVDLVGRVDRSRLRDLLRRARAFIFAADEDFGIAPVEAQACGTPVIAYGRGGALETIRGEGDPAGATGVFFDKQSASAIAAAVRRFETIEPTLSPDVCRRNAERFAEARFRQEMRAFVDEAWTRFRQNR
jgi:glycosyltransferase involved in cell wall biosynthesis